MSGRALVWVVALALLCSACAVDATVTVRVDEDGSGVVRLDVVADPDAVRAVEVGGATLEEQVRLDDLPAAGWTVSSWTRHEDGSASISLRKRFTRVEEVPAILEELDGDLGPLRDAAFSRRRSFFATDFDARVVVDLAAVETGVTSDAELVAALAAQGVDVSALDQQLASRLREALGVRLVVDLPGRERAVVEPDPGQAAALTASSSVADATRIGFVAAAGLLLVAAMVVVCWPRRRRRGSGRRGGGRGPAPRTVRRGGRPTTRGTPGGW